MKKIILFSLANIICLTVTTKVNAMQWLTVRNKVRLYNQLHHSGAKIVLSDNATWEQFYKAQKDAIRLSNIGDSIAQDYEKDPRGFHSELLKTTAKFYVNAIIQQEELAPLHYTNPEDQIRYQNLINDLRSQLQE
jgi:hypothetical protein